MTYRRFFLCLVIAMMLAVLQFGCDSKSDVLVPTEGKILNADGSPMPEVRVDFWPQDNPKSFTTTPYGMTNDKGQFQVVMLDPSKPGARPGKYRVTVLQLGKTNRAVIPEQYTKHNLTPWEVVIPVSGKKDIVLQIKP